MRAFCGLEVLFYIKKKAHLVCKFLEWNSFTRDAINDLAVIINNWVVLYGCTNANFNSFRIGIDQSQEVTVIQIVYAIVINW